MKNILIISLTLFHFNTFAKSVIITGNYYYKNIYVKNAFADSETGFCVYRVKVNGRITTDEVNSSAFEIDFTNHQIPFGKEIKIEIYHKDGCAPKIMNPEVITPIPSFEIYSIEINKNGCLRWVTSNEMGSLNYQIEQYKWNKWIPIGSVKGIGTPGKHAYEIKVNMISGLNKFRVKQHVNNLQFRISPEAFIQLPDKKVNFICDHLSQVITFNFETSFELFDSYGKIITKEFGITIPTSNLDNGTYYLNFENSTSEIVILNHQAFNK